MASHEEVPVERKCSHNSAWVSNTSALTWSARYINVNFSSLYMGYILQLGGLSMFSLLLEKCLVILS